MSALPELTEGERWTEDALAQLRAERYRPIAWIRFVAASLRRWQVTRAAHRSAERQVIAITLLGLGGAFALGAVHSAASGWWAAAWWLTVMVMVEIHLGMLERADGSKLESLAVPNLLSLLRAALVVPLALFGLHVLLVVLAVAGTTDVVDGLVARGWKLATRLGQWLDAGVDASVMGVAAVALVHRGVLPLWVAILVVARYAAPWLVIGAAYFVHAGSPPRDAFVPGRIPGVVALVGLLAVAAGVPGGAVLVVLGAVGGFATFGVSVFRGARAG